MSAEDVGLWLDAVYGAGEGDVLVSTGTNGEWVDGKYTFGKRWREAAGRYAWPTQRQELIDYLTRESAARIDVYVRPYLTPTGQARAKGNATGRRLVHADRDGSSPVELPSIPGLFAVDSGTPGHEHVYVAVTDELSADEHEALCRSLGLVLGQCDAKVSDNDVLRPLGTLNHKTVPPTRVEWLRRPGAPALTGEHLGTVLRVLGCAASETASTPSPDASAIASGPLDLPAAVRAVLAHTSGDRSADTAKVVHACYDAGLDFDATCAAVMSRADLATRIKQKGRSGSRDIERLWDKARGWIAQEDQERAGPGTLTIVGGPVTAGQVAPCDEPARPRFIDWHELEDSPPEEIDWLVPGIVPARRGTALYSATGVGKSLLLLELAVAVACGGVALGVQAAQGVVLYVDHENDPRGDVWARLTAMGLCAADLGDLRYMSYPEMAKLDSPAGGAELLAVAREVKACLVVVDTATRTVRGEENDNNVWNYWDEFTGKPLKRDGIAFVRLDHSGKDADRGQRGGSNKGTDVDLIWRLDRLADDEFKLTNEKDRTPVPDKVVVFRRMTSPRLHSVRISAGDQAAVLRQQGAVWAALDEAGLAIDAGRLVARRVLKDAGITAGDPLLNRVLKARQSQANAFATRPDWAPVAAEGALRLASIGDAS